MKLVFDHVFKNYGVINALKDIDFKINSGDFVFIVGPSGSGKSTLIKLILNQTTTSEGKIFIDDHLLYTSTKKTIESLRRQIGVIFQDYQLIPDKTVEENIALALDIINTPAVQIPQKVDTVINLVNLSSRRHLFPRQLSGGELQRTALARALVVDPKMILADEPTGNLDIENAWNLVKILQDYNQKSGATIIMTTHNLDILESLKKRVITMKYGEIVSDTAPASPQKIKKHKHSPKLKK